jgi:catechol 2,3-dioxygenase-like lactoylglutathione lyase family enzyme
MNEEARRIPTLRQLKIDPREIVGIEFITCLVSDLNRSLEFYRNSLGIVPDFTHQLRAEFSFEDGTALGLWQCGRGMKTGLAVAFAVGDARAAAALFRERGAEIAEAFDTPVCVMAFGEDLDGNGFVVHQRAGKRDAPPARHPKLPTSIAGIDLAEHLVPDPQRSIAFFRDVLGMTPTDIDEQGRGAEFTLADGSTFGVWRPEGGPEGEAGWGGAMMLAVPDVRATVVALRERGVATSDVEEGPVCFMAFVPDPDGIAVIIHQRK